MKKITTSLALALIGVVAGAQSYYQDAANSEMLRHESYHQACRHEVILPQVNGYNVYKADLHTHTIFSDGQVHPSYRVKEAWVDGLDIMAVTEHIEYRPHEALFVDQLKKYISPKYDKAVNNIHGGGEKLDENGIMVRSGLHCAPLAHKKLGTLKSGTVRFSLGIFNTISDIEYLDHVLNVIL